MLQRIETRRSSLSFYLGGKGAIRPKKLETRHENNPGDNKIRNGNRKTGHMIAEELDEQHFVSLTSRSRFSRRLKASGL